jgi:hypothetical protein
VRQEVLIIIGEKRLPVVTREGDRISWGFVDVVTSRAEELEDELDPETYTTKMRGERQRPAARPPARAPTRSCATLIIRTWPYASELPTRPGEVQRALSIGEEGSYIISVKNRTRLRRPGRSTRLPQL